MTFIGNIGLGTAVPDPHRCSRSGCTDSAIWAIKWRNPKIHSEDRIKTWLSCDAHEEYLREFLSARTFPLTVIPISELEPNT